MAPRAYVLVMVALLLPHPAGGASADTDAAGGSDGSEAKTDVFAVVHGDPPAAGPTDEALPASHLVRVVTFEAEDVVRMRALPPPTLEAWPAGATVTMTHLTGTVGPTSAVANPERGTVTTWTVRDFSGHSGAPQMEAVSMVVVARAASDAPTPGQGPGSGSGGGSGGSASGSGASGSPNGPPTPSGAGHGIPAPMPMRAAEGPLGFLRVLADVLRALLEAVGRLGLAVVLGHRVLGPDLLQHPTRRAVVAAVTEEPGLHAQALARRLDLHVKTLRYHLLLLRRAGLVELVKDGPLLRAYPPGAGRAATPASTRARLLALLTRHGPAGREDLAARLGVSPQAVSYHAQSLARAGRVVVHRRGREVEYAVPPPSTAPARGGMGTGRVAAQASHGHGPLSVRQEG